jgi:hypothetical protein
MKCVKPEVIMIAEDSLDSKVAGLFLAQVGAEATLVINVQAHQGAQSDGTPKIINLLITHNTTQFKKSK